MHENANITFELKESKNALDTILSIQPRETGGAKGEGKSIEQILEEICNSFEEKMPPMLNKEQAEAKKTAKRASMTNLPASDASHSHIDSLQV